MARATAKTAHAVITTAYASAEMARATAKTTRASAEMARATVVDACAALETAHLAINITQVFVIDTSVFIATNALSKIDCPGVKVLRVVYFSKRPQD
ncbi:MAG: hypothetical protein KME45_10435 [Stenomitos rutilans HA7619-LM2]|nr:hypothetical protein [Stenomitos rutilans HA7619-LM2]